MRLRGHLLIQALVLALAGPIQASAQVADDEETGYVNDDEEAASNNAQMAASLARPAVQQRVTGPSTIPPMASDDQVRTVLGNVSYAMMSCGYGSRSVRVNIEHLLSDGHGLTRDQRANAAHEAVRRAILFTWQNCPLQAHVSGDRYMVDAARMFMPDGTQVLFASDFRATGVNYGTGLAYDFATVRDTRPDPIDRFFGWLWGWIKTIFWMIVYGSLAILLFKNREPIVRWYYFTFHPHPAAPMVQAALASGTVVNGKVIAASLGEMPASRILREVRIAQGERLVEQMQEMSRWHAQQMQAKAREEYERAAVQSIQEAIALAAAALARAKAFHHASNTVGAGFA